MKYLVIIFIFLVAMYMSAQEEMKKYNDQEKLQEDTWYNSLFVDARIELNSMHFKNNFFKQADSYTTRFVYTKSICVPSCAINVGIESERSWHMFNNEWRWVAGMQARLSHTSKKGTAQVTFLEIPGSLAYAIQHKVRLNNCTPYLGIATHYKDIKMRFIGGVILTGHMIKNVHICENTPDYPYVGVSYRPHNHTRAGTIGISAERTYEDITYGISYHFTHARQKYSTQIYVEQADQHSDAYWQDFATLDDVEILKLIENPLIKCNMHTFGLTIGYAW